MESSQVDPSPVVQPPVRQEAYITVDALKNFMSTMTVTIMQQVCEQVKKAVEAVSTARPLPRFEYVPTGGCEPSRRRDPVTSPRRNERVQEAPHGGGDRQSREDNHGHSIGANAYPNHRSSHGRQRSQPLPLRPMRHTLDEPPRSKSKNKPRAPREEPPNDNELSRAVWAVNAPGFPLAKGTTSVHGSLIALLPYPREVVLPEGVHRR